jgi:hypothetical protein
VALRKKNPPRRAYISTRSTNPDTSIYIVFAYQQTLEGKLLQARHTQAVAIYQSMGLADADPDRSSFETNVVSLEPDTTLELGA